jgi:hypothetical protein
MDEHADTAGTIAAAVGCARCGREVDPTADLAITIVVGRSERLDAEGERCFRHEQVLTFCHLEHANAHLAEHPLRDEWPDSEVLESHDGALGAFGCFLLAAVLLVLLVVGAVVSVGWLWDVVT